MNQPLRIGIVGCGGIAEAHLDGYKNVEGNQIVAVYDISKSSAEKMAAQTGARVAASLEEMAVKDQLDAVSVCTPPSVHLENCAPFLKAGIAVLCEKPLEVNAGRAAELAALVQKTGTLFMTAYCHRFHPAVLALRGLIDKDVLGRPLVFRNIFGGYIDMTQNHRANPKLSGGGVLIDNCSHSVDLFRFLTGEPTAVSAVTGNLVQTMPIEDFGMIHLSVNDKIFGEITSNYSLRGCGNFVEWYGTKGMAIISYWNVGFPELKYRVDGDWIEVDCSAYPNRFIGEITHFVKCIREKKTPSITAADGLRASQIMQAVYQSAEQKKWVAV